MPRKSPLLLLIGMSLSSLLLAAALLAAQPGLFRGAAVAQSMPDLAVRKYTRGSVVAVPGGEVKFEIYLINQGGYVANDVRIVDTLPAGASYVASTNPGFVLIQAGPNQVVWVRDRLTVFERGWLSVTVRVDDDTPPGTMLRNTVYILCLDPESNYDNNEFIYEIMVLPAEPDMQITKKLLAGVPGPGNELSYRIHYWNRGGSVAQNVRITDALPLSSTYVSDLNTGGFTTAQTGAQTVWMTDTVPADSHGDVYLNVLVDADWDPAADWLVNGAEVSTADAEYSYLNNVAHHSVRPESERRYGAAVTSVDDRTMRLVSDAGFDYVLYYLSWARSEPFDDQYDWHLLDAAAWARGPGTESAPPSNPAKLGEFVGAAAARYPYFSGAAGASIRGFIIWNEPNLAAEWGGNAPNAAAYTALLQAAYNGVKAGSPNARVISAGLATTNENSATAVDDRVYLAAMYDAGARTYFDYLGVNPLGFAFAPDDYSDPVSHVPGHAIEPPTEQVVVRVVPPAPVGRPAGQVAILEVVSEDEGAAATGGRFITRGNTSVRIRPGRRVRVGVIVAPGGRVLVHVGCRVRVGVPVGVPVAVGVWVAVGKGWTQKSSSSKVPGSLPECCMRRLEQRLPNAVSAPVEL